MKTFASHIDIAAAPDRVWQVLTAEMPRAPTEFGIVRFQGNVLPESRIRIWSDIAPNRAFDLTVATLDRPRLMVWTGGMPLGLFTGTRKFVLAQRQGGTRFDMTEKFTGPLSGIITRSMPDLTDSFTKFCCELKRRAELQ